VEAYIDDQTRPGWMTFDPTPSAGAQPLGDNTGAWVYMRDLVEAVSQRWTHYVIGYDLRSQVHLYDWFRDRPRFGKLRRYWWAGLPAGLLVALYVVWRRRRRAQKLAPTERTRPDREQQVAASMYRLLEQALLAHGLTRPASLPPLRFAEELRIRSHPLATEIVELTKIYLGVRFGGTPFTDSSMRTYDRRVRAVRTWKRTPATT
jgi:hypothetical protein